MRYNRLSCEPHTLNKNDVRNRDCINMIKQELLQSCQLMFTLFELEKIVPPTTILHVYPNRNIVLVTFESGIYVYINSSPNPYRENQIILPTIYIEPTSVYWIELDPLSASFTLSSKEEMGGYCMICRIN